MPHMILLSGMGMSILNALRMLAVAVQAMSAVERAV